MITADALAVTCGLPRGEARMLLAEATGVSREALVADPQLAVDATAAAKFETLAERRRAGEPIAYLLGRQEFYSRVFEVNADVLIPRPETELLVDLALDALRTVEAPRILDLGTGSGCLAVTLALQRPDAQVVAVDISPAALAVAARNAQRLGAMVQWIASNWYEALADQCFHLIVANPPYVADHDAHLQDLRFEPLRALTAGTDGLAALRAVVKGAPAHLLPGGALLVEHGYDQAAAMRSMLEADGWQSIETIADAAGISRVVAARRPAASAAGIWCAADQASAMPRVPALGSGAPRLEG